MDGVRVRLVALAAPLVLGAVLGVAALLEAPAPAPPTPRGVAVTTSTVFGLPHTTPPPAPPQRTDPVPAPAPRSVPAQTAGHS